MANTKSAKKRAARNDRRAAINKSRMSRLKTSLKKVELAIAAGNAAEADAALKKAQPDISRSAAKNLIHKNAAARKLSRLSSRIKAIKKKA